MIQWKYTQLSQFSPCDTQLLVSGRSAGVEQGGEIIIYNIFAGTFTLQVSVWVRTQRCELRWLAFWSGWGQNCFRVGKRWNVDRDTCGSKASGLRRQCDGRSRTPRLFAEPAKWSIDVSELKKSSISILKNMQHLQAYVKVWLMVWCIVALHKRSHPSFMLFFI